MLMKNWNRQRRFNYLSYKHIDMNSLLIKITVIGGYIAFFLSACETAAPTEDIWKISGSSMGTSYHVTVRVITASLNREQVRVGIKKAIDNVDQKMSTYKFDSELSLFNRQRSTTWQPVSMAMFKVLSAAQQVSKLTAGAFDITVAPIVNLWGFGPGKGLNRLPTAAEITALLPAVGYQKLRLQTKPPALSKQSPAVKIDLSAIAKGFAVDQVADYLTTHGFSDYLVEIGGEVRGHIGETGHRPWQVALEAPVSGKQRISRILSLRNFALATSGDYRNYFEKNGVRYSHTINPRSGYPIRHRLAAVSVLAKNTMLADALATAMMVAGPEEGSTLASAHGIAARFLVRTSTSFEIRETAAWKRQTYQKPVRE